MELAKGLFKIGAVVYVTYLTIAADMDDFVAYMDMGVGQIFALSGDITLTLAFRIVLLLLVMAILDYSFQRWEYEKNLRMTRQEVREEVKQQEGDPMMRSRVRNLQRERDRYARTYARPPRDVGVAHPGFHILK